MSETENEKIKDMGESQPNGAESPAQEPASVDQAPEQVDSDAEASEPMEVSVADETEVAEEDEAPVYQHVSKFSEQQIKVIQIILGILSGAAIWLAIAFGTDSDNVLMQYLFVIIFAVVLLTQRYVERKWGLSTRVFVKYWLISLIVCLVLFVIYGALTGKFTQ